MNINIFYIFKNIFYQILFYLIKYYINNDILFLILNFKCILILFFKNVKNNNFLHNIIYIINNTYPLYKP